MYTEEILSGPMGVPAVALLADPTGMDAASIVRRMRERAEPAEGAESSFPTTCGRADPLSRRRWLSWNRHAVY